MSASLEQQVAQQIEHALEVAQIPPQQRQELVPPRWTLKRLVEWTRAHLQIDCCRETIRKLLKRQGFSWKKARKLLNKADPTQRAEYLATLQNILSQALEQECLVIYVDEAHVYLDAGEGYGWSIRGQRFWISSSSPGRAKVSFFGLYLYNLGQVRVVPFARANQFTTGELLKQIRTEFPEQPIHLIWDGAPYHRAQSVQQSAEILEITLQPLPAYSPDFMPVEHLWHWLREEVTYHVCYDKKADLIAQVDNFVTRINATPNAVADRLWVQNHLDPEIEKLRIST